MTAGVRATTAALAGMLAAGTASCATPSPMATGPGPRWDDGAHYTYQVAMSNLVEMGADNVLIDLQLTGTLELHAQRAGDGSIELVSRLANLEAVGKSSGGDAQLAELVRDLQRPWIIELRGGQADAIRLPSGMPAAVVGVERTLAAALQFAPPPSASAREWPAIERDATGRYAASYRALAEAGRFSMQKLRYESLALGVSSVAPAVKIGPGAPGDPPEVLRSSHELDVSGNQLRSSRGEDQIRARVTATASVVSTTSLALTLVGADRSSPPAELTRAATKSIRLVAGEPYAPHAPPLKLDAAKSAGWTFERAVSELEQLEQTREPPRPPPGSDPEVQTLEDSARAQRMAAAFKALAAIFRREPDTIKQATQLVRTHSAIAPAVMDALGSATTSESQVALLEVATDTKLPTTVRQSAAGSLIRSAHPSEAAVAGLVGLLDDALLDEHAGYGLGTFARKLRNAGEVERAKRISELLILRLASAREVRQHTIALRGIANSAYGGALEPVRRHLTDHNPFVRAAAVEALRLIDLPGIDALIAERMTSDERPVVRNAALDAARLRPATPTLIAAVGQMSSKAPDAQGRMQAVRLLVRWLPERDAAVRAALEEAAHADPEPKVRDEARRALEQAPPPPA